MIARSCLPLLCTASLAAADVVWVGGQSDNAFDEANWDLSSSSVTQIDPNVPVLDNVLIQGAPAPVDVHVAGIQQGLLVGDAFTLRIDGSQVFTSSNDGIGGEPGTGQGPTVHVQNGGDLATYFISNGVHLVIDATSSAHLWGPATPVNGATIDITQGSLLAFPQETVADFLAEHLSKLTVNGNPAVPGSNVSVVSDGATGCVIEVVEAAAVPRNGLGINALDYQALNVPKLGGTWDAQILQPPTIGVTIVALGVAPTPPPPASTPFPLGAGELLIDISIAPALDVRGGLVPDGLHSLPIPNDPTLFGAKLYTQGLRLEVVPGVDIVATPLNALDLQIGA